MKSIQKEIKLYKDDINFLCKINAKVYFDENNELDEGDVYFIHPLTGSEHENINSIFMNWKEAKDEYNDY